MKYSEAETDYYLKLLEIETGLDDISDYIYYPDLAGLDPQAESSEIAAKIIADRRI